MVTIQAVLSADETPMGLALLTFSQMMVVPCGWLSTGDLFTGAA
jgi:hypothetical protein